MEVTKNIFEQNLFLKDKENLTVNQEFILLEEKNNLLGKITREQVETFSKIIVALKKDLEMLNKRGNAENLTALYNFYLGELYAKCQCLYNASCQLVTTPESNLEQTRLKSAIIYYLNAMLDTQAKPGIKNKTSWFFAWRRSWWQSRAQQKKIAASKRKIFFRVVLTLTEQLNVQPAIATAIDGLYPQAQITLQNYIQQSSKILHYCFWRSFCYKEAKVLQKMLLKYNYTIFEKMGIDVSRARLKARKKV